MSTPSSSVMHTFAGYHPLLAQNEAYARTNLSWVRFPYCPWSVVLCMRHKGATGFFDPVVIPPPILARNMVKGETNRKGMLLYIRIWVVNPRSTTPRAAVCCSLSVLLYCTPFSFQGRIKKFYSLICNCQFRGKKAGRSTAACRGLAYLQLPECLGN